LLPEPRRQAVRLTQPEEKHSDDMTVPISNACMRRATRSPDWRHPRLKGPTGYPRHRLQAIPRVPPLQAAPHSLLILPRHSKRGIGDAFQPLKIESPHWIESNLATADHIAFKRAM
jgi:hypothetical protein